MVLSPVTGSNMPQAKFAVGELFAWRVRKRVTEGREPDLGLKFRVDVPDETRNQRSR